MQVVQAYRFAFDPTSKQVQMLNSHAGAARFAYNQMLAVVLANWNQRTAEKTYGLEAEQLTPSVNWSFYSLRKEWNRRKPELAPWWKENSKESYATGIERLAAALKNWSDSHTGKRPGPKIGVPRFKALVLFSWVRFRAEFGRHTVPCRVSGCQGQDHRDRERCARIQGMAEGPSCRTDDGRRVLVRG